MTCLFFYWICSSLSVLIDSVVCWTDNVLFHLLHVDVVSSFFLWQKNQIELFDFIIPIIKKKSVIIDFSFVFRIVLKKQTIDHNSMSTEKLGSDRSDHVTLKSYLFLSKTQSKTIWSVFFFREHRRAAVTRVIGIFSVEVVFFFSSSEIH